MSRSSPKNHPEAPLSLIRVDPGRPEPLYRQVYDAIRAEILSGRLRPGQKLAASRRLADQLSVSRTTTLLAFEMLLAEGYVEGRVGSGTFVSRELPERLLLADTRRAAVPPRSAEPPPRIAARTSRLGPYQDPAPPGPAVPFRMGLPALSEFPYNTWGRTAARLVNSPKKLQWDYGDAAGEPALRAAVAEHVLLTRGVECSVDQVLITGGSQQGLDLCARVLVDHGDRCWIEDPGYLGAHAALTSAGVLTEPVPVDAEGLIVSEGRKRAPESRLVYVTPSHQYPLGVTMSLARRLELLEWARQSDSWILEDDYDSEYRYVGKPLAPLKALDSGRRVVYVGTFSKTLFPALRIGYLIVPDSLVDPFLVQRYASSRQSPTFEQSVLARFMTEGHLSRHVRRMRVLYQERQEILREAVLRYADGLFEIPPAPTGMHVVGWLPDGMDDRVASEYAARTGVIVAPLSAFHTGSSGKPGLLLGYTGFDARQIREGVRRLVRVLEKISRGSAPAHSREPDSRARRTRTPPQA